MGKKLIVLVFLLTLIVPISVLGIDIALSIASFDLSKFNATVGTPSVSLSEDNTSINYSVNLTLTTPKLGFIPKTIILNLNFYEGDTLIGQSFTKSITLGTNLTEIISGTISIEEVYQILITEGESVTFTVKGVLKIAILGITVPGIEYDIPDHSFTVP